MTCHNACPIHANVSATMVFVISMCINFDLLCCIGFSVPELPIIERRNWLIHLHYVHKNFDKCKDVIEQQLAESGGMCEYALFAKGTVYLIHRHNE